MKDRISTEIELKINCQDRHVLIDVPIDPGWAMVLLPSLPLWIVIVFLAVGIIYAS